MRQLQQQRTRPASYVSALSRLTQRQLADHCTAILQRAIAESQARQIAILARHGIHPHAYTNDPQPDPALLELVQTKHWHAA